MGEDRFPNRPNLSRGFERVPKQPNAMRSRQVREGAGVLCGRIQRAPFDPYFRLGLGCRRRGTIKFIQAEQCFE